MENKAARRITVKEAMARASEVKGQPVAEETVRGWLRRGLITGYRLMGSVYIDADSLERFLTPQPYVPDQDTGPGDKPSGT